MSDGASFPPPRSAGAFDVMRARADFPALRQEIHGVPLVYLDNAATVQKPAVVIEEITRVYTDCAANVHRGAHTLGARATEVYETARAVVAELIGASSPEEIVFTSGCTAAINLVAFAWGDAHLAAGDEVLVSDLEHHSNLLPWQALCARRGARLRKIPLDARGELDLDVFANQLSTKTRLVAVAEVSNALGTVTPLEQIVRMAHAAGARVLVDGAQAVARKVVDVRRLGCDFYAFSGHKLYGPFGIGVLYARRELLEQLPPFMTGGGMVDRVGEQHSTFAEVPRRFEPGTPNVAGAAGLARAISYVRSIGLEAIQDHESDLLAYTQAALGSEPGLRLIGSPRHAIGVISFLVEGIHPHDIATILDQHGVAVRAGHHCAQPVMDHFALTATVRASFALYNTREDVDVLVRGLRHVRAVFES